MQLRHKSATTPEQIRLQQARCERHGMWILCLIFVVIIPPEAVHLFVALFSGKPWGKWILEVLFPLLIFHSCTSLWLGNEKARKWLAFFMIIRALPWLIMVFAFIALTIRNFKEETASAALLLARLFLTFPLAVVTIYCGVVLLCLCSKSLVAFARLRMRTAPHWTSLPRSLTEALGQPQIEDRIQSAFMASFSSPRYTEFSAELIDVLEESELEDAIVAYVDSQLEQGQDEEDVSKVCLLKSLPPGFQTVYTLWWLRAEVDNGGFFQFLVNKGMDFALLTLENCRHVDRDDVRDVLIRAIECYLQNEEHVAAAQEMLEDVRLLIETNWGERYVAAENACGLDEVNRAWFAIDRLDLDAFIRNNVSLFQGTGRTPDA